MNAVGQENRETLVFNRIAAGTRAIKSIGKFFVLNGVNNSWRNVWEKYMRARFSFSVEETKDFRGQFFNFYTARSLRESSYQQDDPQVCSD